MVEIFPLKEDRNKEDYILFGNYIPEIEINIKI